MRKIVVLAILFVLSGCATSTENKITVSITNTTPFPMTIRCGTSIFGTSVVVMPGQTWSGWVDRRLIGSKAWATIEPYSIEKHSGLKGR